MPDTIWVKSGLTGDLAERVSLFEIDDRHPGGEAFIAGQDSPPRQVGRTSKVLTYLHDGRLIESSEAALEAWREERAARRQQALIDDAAMFPGGQRGDLSNRIAALEAQIASLQEAPRRGPGRPPNQVRDQANG
jgi:hypothetical protein